MSGHHRCTAARLDVLLVTEPGGHLLEMWSMRELAAADRRAWCTTDSPDVRSLLRDEDVTLAHGPSCRNVRNLVRNLAVAWRLVRRRRPRVILCTGSGVVVPFAWVGRLLGARVLYVECGGRVEVPSLSCRLVSPVAHRTYVQWTELAVRARRAAYHGRLPWERGGMGDTARATSSGVVITVGTSREYAFDRLVRASEYVDGPLVVQRGISDVAAPGARVVDYMPFEALNDAIAAAGAVVTHAGIGSVLLALSHGHRPIVMPRLPALGEGVDDHQVRFARRLEAEGLATVVADPAHVPAALRALPERGRIASARGAGHNALLATLGDEIRDALA